MGEFDLAVPRDPGELGVELMAQARPNGRIQDHFGLALGGSRLLEKKLLVSGLINKEVPAPWKLSLGVWPRDVMFRQNMATTAWLDVRDMVAAGEARILGVEDAQVENEEFFNQIDASTSRGRDKTSASIRWALGIGDDLKVQLLLQGLLGPAATINGKPSLRG